VDSILESVKWLGFTPYKVTYASNYFDQLYDFAITLIKTGKAYICFQTPEEMSESRRKKEPSSYRDTPVETNLEYFEEMKNGTFSEGHCTLRMKMDYTSNNPNMWDLVAYRISHAPHYRTGDRWKIYPSYDFTHAICDSLEHITHSLCTLEFETRRESYYWLLDALNLYKPYVWEFSRLNLDNCIMSKRKNLILIKNALVSDWDDPRLVTLKGLRRRGYTPDIIKAFCNKIGITRVANTIISYDLFEETCRDILNIFSERFFAVKDPLKMVITNIPEGEVRTYARPKYPADTESEIRTVECGRTLYIENRDFRMDDSRKYFGLALNERNGQHKWVRLRYTDLVVRVTDVDTDSDGNVTCIYCVYDETGEITKTKTAIHWVSDHHKAELIFRDYGRLFTVQSPGDLGTAGELREAINPDSVTITNGLVELSYLDYASDPRRLPVQFERHGYYYPDRSVIDADSKEPLPENITVNLTVPLKVTKTVF
jgi:glutaminyl-tRNA synthetase